jgi:Raf kinase inhibitor-like YbhB/YbcL family protein
MKAIRKLFAALCLATSIVCAQTAPQTLAISSPTLKAGEPIAVLHTPDGRNESPAINWSNAPATTKQFAVICEDPDAGVPPPFVHWVVYNIPATAKGLPAALPIDGSAMPTEIAGAVQGLSGFRRAIYRGPAPPPGKAHHYHFVVYALDALITIKADQPPLTRAQLLDAMHSHVIAQGELVATYERKMSAPPP